MEIEEESEDGCPIWGEEAVIAPVTGDFLVVNSPRAGGKYKISGSAKAMLSVLTPEQKARLSFDIADANIRGIVPELDSTTIQETANLPPPPIEARLNLLLKTANLLATGFDSNFNLNQMDFFPSALISDDEKASETLHRYWEFAGNRGLVTYEPTQDQSGEYHGFVSFTLDGHIYVEQMGRQLTDSPQIFVAMWFGGDMSTVYNEAIAPAIRAAGYQPMRIDNKEFNGRIDDAILAEIRKSKAVFVDLTCGIGTYLGKNEDGNDFQKPSGIPRGGVYYEAGFAQGLGLPVVWSVESGIADTENVVHFDTRQYNQIRWNLNDLPEFKKRLTDRLVVTLGQGPE